ncbi:MAG TPA: CAP domain-containing protein [Acidimicrobiales bacterium]|nr:CAP domain-containing protein [Acidimicrobiales bacterium]
MRRLVVLVVALFALSLGLVMAPPASAQTDPATAESEFVSKINALRASKGLRQLEVHGELVALGRSWAGEMAKVDRISHNPNLANAVKADWQKLGENVGVGMTVDKLHQAFIDSPTHYKNLVDPDWTHLGVGVVLGRDGAIFTAHQFMQLRSTSSAPPTTAAPRPTTTTARRPPVTPPPPPTTEPPVETTTTTTAPPPPATPPVRLVLVLEQLAALDALGV